jgi:Protein of unknown function (DUF1573)
MKQLFFMLSVFLFFTACKQGPTEKKDNGLQEVRLDDKVSNADIVRLPVSADKPLDTTHVPKIQLVETAYNFGEITEGVVVKHNFKFKNTGKTPLIITDVQTTCGCTVPTWNKNPIQPDEVEAINVEFNSKGKQGKMDKPITIIANTFPVRTECKLVGFVK